MAERAKKDVPLIFDAFVSATKRQFAFLGDQGFTTTGPEVHGSECSLAYVKADQIEITISTEPGALPWVRVVANTDGRAEEMSLETFAKRFCAAEPMIPDDRDHLESRLSRYAELIQSACLKFLK